jgi:hypothetical protein
MSAKQKHSSYQHKNKEIRHKQWRRFIHIQQKQKNNNRECNKRHCSLIEITPYPHRLNYFRICLPKLEAT